MRLQFRMQRNSGEFRYGSYRWLGTHVGPPAAAMGLLTFSWGAVTVLHSNLHSNVLATYSSFRPGYLARLYPGGQGQAMTGSSGVTARRSIRETHGNG